MGLETARTIAELNASNPLGSDQVKFGDDHLRLIKSVLKSDLSWLWLYNRIYSFQLGASVTANDCLFNEADNNFYIWTGPYTSGSYFVAAGSTPATAGGVGPNQWVAVQKATYRDALAGENGADYIGHKGDITGEVLQTLADIANNNITIRTFGGRDDWNGTSGTNNFNAIVAYINYLKVVGGQAKFPHRSTGKYFFDGFSTETDLSQIELDVDYGVSFHLSGSFTSLVTKGLKANREIPIYIGGGNYTFRHGMHQYRKPSEVMPSLPQTAGSYEIPVQLLGSEFIGYDISAGRTPLALTATADTVTVPYSGAGVKAVAACAVRLGEEIGCYNNASNGTVLAGVLTPNGFAYLEQNLTTKEIKFYLNSTFIGVALTGPLASTRNQFNSGHLSVKLVSNTAFSVLINGVSLGVFNTNEPISAVAFGAYGRTTPLVFGGVYKLTNSNLSGARPLQIVALGDSTSDPAVPCSQYEYMMQFLATAGCQVYNLVNLAKSGDTSSAQRTALENTGIAGYDFCIAQIGINDIQGGIPVATFIANMEAIADRCTSNGVKLIVGLPTMWYPQAEATPFGQTGQNTLNDAAGAPYRTTLIRAMAAKGAIITTAPLKYEGIVGGSWLGRPLADPVLMDNIHPTAYGRMMMGYATAQAVLGALNPIGHVTRKTAPMPARWKQPVISAGVQAPLLQIRDGELTFLGALDLPVVPANGQTILAIDKELANGRFNYATVPTQTAGGPVGMCNMVIDPNGNMSLYGVSGGSVSLVLDGITLRR